MDQNGNIQSHWASGYHRYAEPQDISHTVISQNQTTVTGCACQMLLEHSSNHRTYCLNSWMKLWWNNNKLLMLSRAWTMRTLRILESEKKLQR
jgi:hypothetical protein